MYKPGDKLVLEVKREKIDKVLGIKTYIVKDVLDATFPEHILDEFERLDSDYINEHFGDIQDEAYEEGKKAGIEIGELSGYKKGMNEVDKIIKMLWGVGENCLQGYEMIEIFGTRNLKGIFTNYGIKEIISKIEAWEKSKTEIKVGDVVEHELAGEALVIHIGKYETCTLLNSKTLYTGVAMRCLVKTGRTIDIASVLEQIGGTA